MHFKVLFYIANIKQISNKKRNKNLKPKFNKLRSESTESTINLRKNSHTDTEKQDRSC